MLRVKLGVEKITATIKIDLPLSQSTGIDKKYSE